MRQAAVCARAWPLRPAQRLSPAWSSRDARSPLSHATAADGLALCSHIVIRVTAVFIPVVVRCPVETFCPFSLRFL